VAWQTLIFFADEDIKKLYGSE